MEQWEYWTGFLFANIETEGVKEYFQQRWPDWKNPPKFAPQTLIPKLNDYGAEGWELMHMEPGAKVGVNGDVLFLGGNEAQYSYVWSNVYFCVFKRRICKET